MGSLLFIILLVLKLAGVIAISWTKVILIPVAVAVVEVIVYLLFVFLWAKLVEFLYNRF